MPRPSAWGWLSLGSTTLAAIRLARSRRELLCIRRRTAVVVRTQAEDVCSSLMPYRQTRVVHQRTSLQRHGVRFPEARLVVWVIVNVEEWNPLEPMPRTVLTPRAGGVTDAVPREGRTVA